MKSRKVVNLLSLLVMVSVNIITPFSYADVEDWLFSNLLMGEENLGWWDGWDYVGTGGTIEYEQDSSLDIQDDEPIFEDSSFLKWIKQNEISLMSLWDPQLDNREYDTITITRPSSLTDADGPESFVIMDRNLWAVQAGTSTTSYGYHYQWWNNYGFSMWCFTNGCTDSVTDSAVDVAIGWAIYDESYDNNWYYWENFIKDETFGNTYWKNGVQPNWLWWWSWDSSANNWGLDTIQETAKNRQWPCPDWRHVPSVWEWRKVMEYRCIRNSTYCSNTWQIGFSSNLLYFKTTTQDGNFMNYIKLPKAWMRTRYQANMWNPWSYWYYWTSTPGAQLILNVPRNSDWSPKWQATYRNNWHSVRCFQNLYVAPQPQQSNIVTYDANGHWTAPSSVEVVSWWKLTEPTPVPTAEWYTFKWWYKEDWCTNAWNFENDIVTWDITLYAKWEANTYTISFNANLDWVTDPESQTWTYGSVYGELPELSKAWYTFTWWYDAEELVTWWTIFMHTWDITLTARWTVNSYTVTFNLNGWDGEIVSQTVPEWSYATRPQPNPSKEWWNFIWWYTGYYNQEFDFNMIPIMWDITLYAWWTQVITLNPNGWAFSWKQIDETMDVVYTKKVSQQNRMRDIDLDYIFTLKEWYMFGWRYTTQTNQTQKWTWKVNDSNEITMVYAKWIPVVNKEITFWNTKFEIMDRNLWTETVWTWSSSYWSFFQWWNNFAFPKNLQLLNYSNMGRVDASAYWPWNYYYNNVFKIFVWWNWFLKDWDSSYNGNLWWNTTNTDEARQWPCPNGYHVPSKTEWNNIISAYNTWFKTQDKNEVCGELNSPKCFSNLLLLPYAWFISDYATDSWWWYVRTPSLVNDTMHYRSSEYGVSTAAYTNSNSVTMNTNMPTNDGLPIRCFKNNQVFGEIFNVNYDSKWWSDVESTVGVQLSKLTKPSDPSRDRSVFGGWYRDEALTSEWNFNSDVLIDDITLYAKWTCESDYEPNADNTACGTENTVTYDANGHWTAPLSVEVVSWWKLTEPTPAPTAEWYIFKWWYKEAWCINAWDFESDTVTWDITLYAKWHKDSCAENEEWYEEISACATRDADNIVYYWMDENWKWVISIISWDTILTMLDKNEWANVAWIWEDSYGELYQRWNNAPIKSVSAVKNERVEYENYWPWHSFYDATFRYGSTMYDYWQNGSTDNDTHYNNLWWWSGDDTAWDWWWINNWDMRQWPCDTWYHVPSIMEWESVLHIFASIVGQDLKGSTLHHFTNSTNAWKFKNAFKLPFPGFRYSNTSLLEYQGSIGYYWSSSPYYGDDRPNNARTFYLNSSYVDANGSNLRTSGNPVRCFKDSTSAPATRTITFNENGWDILGAEWTDGQWILIQKVENWKLAQAPIGVIKDGATFSHWENVSDNSEFDLSTMDITQDVTLRAMWDITLYNITYHLDWWTQSSPKTGYTIEDETFTLVNPTRERYIFAWWTWSNGNELQTTVTITQWSKYEDLEYYANWYEDFNDNGQNDADETKYTVIYTDWVEGEEVFADQETENILSWSATPAFGWDTTRSGYVFSGWNPEVEATVLADATYVAEWKVDSNNNGIADEDESHFTVKYTDWVVDEEVFADEVTSSILSWSATPAFGWNTTRSGYVFSGWNPAVAWTVIADVTYTAIWWEDKNHNGIDDSTELVAITFNAWNHGKVNNSTKYTTDKIYLPWYNNYPAAPSPIADNGWKFAQWSPAYKVWEMIPLSGAELEYTAQWNSNWWWSSSSGWWGGWGWSTKPDTPKEEQKPVETPKETLQKEDQQESSLETQDDEQNTKDSQQMDQTSDKSSEWQDNRGIKSSGNSYTKEQEEAYEFARSNWITTKSTIQEANMNGNLTRIQMAKMLSQYAINVLWKEPDTSKEVKFNDVTAKRDADYDNWVTLAYQLWIMWQNMKNNKFRPNDEVTRWEFVTALSRLLYNTSDGEYKSTSKYYTHHIDKLEKEWIITKPDPKMKERRWYVMIMLKRSVES